MKVHKIRFGKQIIKFAIKRTKRKKTMAITVGLDEGVKVRIPYRMATKKVYFLIKKKVPWVMKHLNAIKELNYAVVKHEFVSGESFVYLGRHFRLRVKRIKNTEEPEVVMNAGYLETKVNSALNKRKQADVVRSALITWYKQHALQKLSERVSIYVRKIGISRPIVVVRDQKKRWGSCNTNGTLRINWRIIMAPMSVVDYVIAHELCHLKYSNHSVRFWENLRTVIPDYQSRRYQLRSIGSMLTF